MNWTHASIAAAFVIVGVLMIKWTFDQTCSVPMEGIPNEFQQISAVSIKMLCLLGDWRLVAVQLLGGVFIVGGGSQFVRSFFEK